MTGKGAGEENNHHRRTDTLLTRHVWQLLHGADETVLDQRKAPRTRKRMERESSDKGRTRTGQDGLTSGSGSE